MSGSPPFKNTHSDTKLSETHTYAVHTGTHAQARDLEEGKNSEEQYQS